MTTRNTATVFDYRALRLLIGLIALALPFFVSLISSSPLASISASYYTEARDGFVGALFVVSAFLWAYNGHSLNEAMASKIASLAAVSIAIFPTACDGCETDLISSIHYGAAATLFVILAYFCFGPFRQNTKGKKGKTGRRSKIYYVCGWIMVGCIVFMLVTQITLPAETIKALSVTYWAELIALIAFGIAWIVAGKILPPLVDKSEALQLFGQ